MNIEDKRRILDSAKGGFFTVQFIKKSGELREMNCKRWTENALTYGSKNVQKNPCAHLPHYYAAVDMQKGEFRNINLQTLLRAKVNGKVYTF